MNRISKEMRVSSGLLFRVLEQQVFNILHLGCGCDQKIPCGVPAERERAVQGGTGYFVRCWSSCTESAKLIDFIELLLPVIKLLGKKQLDLGRTLSALSANHDSSIPTILLSIMNLSITHSAK